MDRAELFRIIGKKIGSYYSNLLIIALGGTVLMRLVNTESSLIFSWIILMPVMPTLCVMALASVQRILDLHRHHHTGDEPYVAPSIISLKLLPFSIVVPLIIMLPPFMVVSLIFGMEGHGQEHTSLLSLHVFMSLIAAWYFLGVNPYIKRMVSGVVEP